MAKANISKRAKKGGGFFSTLKFIFILGCACALAGVASLELYLSSLPPINNLEQFKPNIVTKIYSGDGEIIKTFTAYTYEKIEYRYEHKDELTGIPTDFYELDAIFLSPPLV